ncbi:MAG: Dethiobiotin synthetase [Cyanobacteria bacterium P01_A01_bin.114]
MDFKTACTLVSKQTTTDGSEPESFLARLQQFESPIPGHATSLLLALKVIADGLKDSTTLERSLAHGLYKLAYESRWTYEAGRRNNVEWPPLLDEDIERIAIAVAQIFSGA